MTNKPPKKDDWTKQLTSGGKPGVSKDTSTSGKQAKAAKSKSEQRSSLDVAESDDSPNTKPAENALGVRIAAFGMAIVCVGVSIYFVPTQPMMALAYIVALVTGSYMSYINRHVKTSWQSKVVFGGIALVGVNCWLELQSGVELGDFSAFSPGIHFLAGTYVMQSFELRTRNEINTSMLLGLIILALIAPLSKSIIFGIAILIYLCFLVSLLYFDCVKRTGENAAKEQITEVALTSANEKKNVLFKGNAVVCLSALPIASMLLFLLIPRADGFVDNLYTYVSTKFGTKSTTPMMMPDALPEKAKRWAPPDRKKQKASKPVLSSENKKKSEKAGDLKSSGDVEKSHDEVNEAGAKSDSKNPGATRGKEGKGSKGAPSNGDLSQKKSGAEKGKGKGAKSAKEKDASTGDISYDDAIDVSLPANTSDALAMRVRSNRTCYMKMFGFDNYDESGKWTSTLTDATELERPSRGGIDLSKLQALSVSPNYPALQLNQECIIERDLSRDIPAAWVPTNLDLKAPQVTVDEMGSIRLTEDGELKKGTKYKVTSSLPVYNLPKMRTEPSLAQEAEDDIRYRLSRYLQLPKGCPDELVSTAEEQIKSGDNWFTKTEKLTEYLRHNYKYSYDKKHEEKEDPLLTFFSDDKTGDCKDFATALVLMSRALGVPARLICGFSPGELNSVSGFHEVKLKNWHSWAEVYIPGNGWVPFDATPNGYLPDKPREHSYDLEALENQKNEPLEQLSKPKSETQQVKPAVSWQQIVGGLSTLLILGICLFFLIKAVIKAIKKARENAPGNHPAKKILKKVETDLKRWKVVHLPHETGPEFSKKVKLAARERTRLGDTIDKNFNSNIESFMDKYEAAYYGNKELLVELESLSKAIHDTVVKTGKSNASAPGSGVSASSLPEGNAVKRPSPTAKK